MVREARQTLQKRRWEVYRSQAQAGWKSDAEENPERKIEMTMPATRTKTNLILVGVILIYGAIPISAFPELAIAMMSVGISMFVVGVW